VTERTDGTTERVVERDAGTPHADHGGSGVGTTYVDGGGSGVGGVIIGIAVLALVAIVAFFLMTQNRNDSLRTSAVTGAASSVSRAADNVGSAASRAADSVAPSSAPAPSSTPQQ
jgi:predicted lipid-binding transport protein (Tim44 family)